MPEWSREATADRAFVQREKDQQLPKMMHGGFSDF